MRLITAWIMGLVAFLAPRWDGQTRFTVIAHDDNQVLVASFDPQSLQGTRVKIPDDLNITAADGRGEWLAKNIYKAGSADWAADSLASYLGIAYLARKESLGLWDRLSWSRYENKINWTDIDLNKNGLTKSDTKVDGQTVLELTTMWYDQAKLWFASQIISDLHLNVVVVNTTDAAGLGSQAANIAESMGFKVEAVTDSNESVNQCQVRAPDHLQKNIAVINLAAEFGCQITASPSGRIQLILGQDYKTKLRGYSSPEPSLSEESFSSAS